MDTPSLPLLQLPSHAIMEVLKSMDAIDKIAISLVSNATKSLVTRVHLRNTDWHIDIGNTFKLFIYIYPSVFSWHFEHDDPETNEPVRLVKKNEVRDRMTTTYEWTKEGFGIKNWIHHLLRITNTSNIANISFYAAGQRFSMDFVEDIIKGLNISELSMQRECSNAYSQSILNSVKTQTLTMNHNPYHDRKLFQKTLMQNFKGINFATGPFFRLNDLLAMNSSTIHLRTPQNITIKTLNKFLKCWKTGSNRQLRYMTIGIRSENIDEVLRGIKHNKCPEDQTWEFQVPESIRNGKGFMLRVNGGYEICAFDGRKAIFLCEVGVEFNFLVWPF